MTNERKIKLHDEIIFYLCELISDDDDLRNTLHAIGYFDCEIDEIMP